MVERVRREIEQEYASITGTRLSSERARWFARVVIESMIEPTNLMKDCGVDAGWFFDTYGNGDRGREAAANLWRNMIRKALPE